ncbi:MAG: hypothetical protein CL943_03310 [Candidatus Diapherotrites archaeon]|uniref:Thioredoxin domain-containing protein n=1 Tax=Candidatus Iainarchaeum sp. TaxID=3101447 RepID=A0A2D6M1N0_9ARCH|nr:hypothetical protein [Candidatus Diapherotrites archaeon]|tara:strand:+ start:1605 stop:2201 length:597 start_codon:yes stop_codon:yes gene_type:complete
MSKLKEMRKENKPGNGLDTKIILLSVVGVIAVIAIIAFIMQPTTPPVDTLGNSDITGIDEDAVVGEIRTFKDNGEAVKLEDGKPVIRLFSTTWCSHCKWVGSTYEKVVKEYVAAGKIVAYHWEVDILDDTLTPNFEGVVPASELAVFRQFNPGGTIPTFVFGEKYSRVGNGYETQNDLASEEAEFRGVIEAVIAEAQE